MIKGHIQKTDVMGRLHILTIENNTLILTMVSVKKHGRRLSAGQSLLARKHSCSIRCHRFNRGRAME